MGIFVNLIFNKISFNKLNYAQFNSRISFRKYYHPLLPSTSVTAKNLCNLLGQWILQLQFCCETGFKTVKIHPNTALISSYLAQFYLVLHPPVPPDYPLHYKYLLYPLQPSFLKRQLLNYFHLYTSSQYSYPHLKLLSLHQFFL